VYFFRILKGGNMDKIKLYAVSKISDSFEFTFLQEDGAFTDDQTNIKRFETMKEAKNYASMYGAMVCEEVLEEEQ